MIDKVLDTIRENDMFQAGDKVVIALSGGPDSICLMHILYVLREKLGISLVAAHVNHCLRGEDSDKDEEYVKEICKKLDIECYVKKADIQKISKEQGLSSEMAGREVRYEFFNEILSKIQGNKIALAHNANDQAETVIMRMFRGSGLEGLTGIKAVRDNIYVRPIINIERSSIEDYCSENKLNPRIDKTNLENIYTRNKIRLELIPYIEKNFNPDIIRSINRLAQTIESDNDYIKNAALNKYNIYCKKESNRVIISPEAFLEHDAILTRIIRICLKKIRGNLYNFEKHHIYDIISLQKGSTGKEIMLPGKVRILNNYGEIHLYINESKEEQNLKEYTLILNSENKLSDMGLNISLKLINNKDEIDFREDELTKYFDYDKINESIKIRYRRDGDRFTPFGMSGSKKLKNLFIDLKVPKEKRDNIPLVIFDDQIAWIIGYRISDKFKIDKQSKNILQIKVEKGGKTNGE